MIKICYILPILLSVILWGCTDNLEVSSSSTSGEGNVQIVISSSDMPEIVTRSDADNTSIESVVLFAFNSEGTLVKKMYQYFDSDEVSLSMHLSDGTYTLCVVCNLPDPESVYEYVTSLETLNTQYVSIQNADGAYRGKFVMFKEESVTISSTSTEPINIEVERLASFHDFTIRFVPEEEADQFEITEVKMNNIPKGSWIVPHPDVENDLKGNTGDWVYREKTNDMAERYFTSDRMDLEQKELSVQDKQEKVKWQYTSSYTLFENRRGAVETSGTSPYEYNDTYWPGSETLAQSASSGSNDSEQRLFALRQYYKRYLAQTVKEPVDGENLKFTYATYLTISGIYQVGSTDETFQVTYHVYLGNDNFKDFNIKRNVKYITQIDIKSMNMIDTRVEWESLSAMTLSVPDEVLDAHCNTVKAVLFSPDPWEVWVEHPDQTPWLELSGSSVYRSRQVGPSTGNQETDASYRMEGTGRVLRNIYIHTDEFIPDLKDPTKNNAQTMRSGRIAFRKKGSTDIQYVTVWQYPAQLAVLHIKYDIHTMKEVRDTFYIERILEKKHLPWGFEKYWSFITDDLIASGRWDGLSNTRKLYQVGIDGDKWGVPPAYPKDTYPNGIPESTALGYVLGKNRDRDGDGQIGYDEIMWYFPARNEVEQLYEAWQAGNLSFEGTDDIFHTSSPSAADPEGITTGFSYYVKMSNGKYGIGQRDRTYNVIAFRRKNNEWSGPNAGDANFTVTVETGWTDEELVMPKY